MDRAVVEIERDDAAATTFVVHDEIKDEVLDEIFGRMLERGTIERVQHGVTGAVGSGAGTLCRTLAEMSGHAAEGPLIDLAVLGARERNAPMLELVNGGRRIAHHVLDRVLVSEPIGALDGVVHVPAPIVLAHVAQGCGDAALRRYGVRAGWENLGDAGSLEPGLTAADNRAQSRAAGADDDHVISVILDRVGAAVDCRAIAVGRTVRCHRLTLQKTA